MSTLLQTHLEQISLCAQSIASLPFDGPNIFTNALLSPNHDITSLIRDTEQHERALFHLAPPPLPSKSNFEALGASTAGVSVSVSAAGRRATQFGGGASARQPKNKAVAAVLGGDLYQKTRRTEYDREQKRTGEIDVEVLLMGAEKLAAVYPLSGAQDKIHALRRRHQQLEANIAHYETRVAEQTRELQAMSRPTKDRESFLPDDDEMKADEIPLTKEDLAREEEEVRELERKKKGLEERVEGMDRDLGGLMR